MIKGGGLAKKRTRDKIKRVSRDRPERIIFRKRVGGKERLRLRGRGKER